MHHRLENDMSSYDEGRLCPECDCSVMDGCDWCEVCGWMADGDDSDDSDTALPTINDL